jgi:hypothetical protein
VTTVDAELDVGTEEWYVSEPYEKLEPIRFPYDLGDKEMKELCKWIVYQKFIYWFDYRYISRCVQRCTFGYSTSLQEAQRRKVLGHIERN